MRETLARLVLIATLCVPALAIAQETAGEDPLEDRAEVYQAAEPGAQTENIPGGMLMVVAYGIVWVLAFGYMVSLGYRQAGTQRDLERLREDLAERPADEG